MKSTKCPRTRVRLLGAITCSTWFVWGHHEANAEEPHAISSLLPTTEWTLHVPPSDFHGSLALPIRCADGGLSCVFVLNRVDLDEGPGSEDYDCKTGAYDGHPGVDFVKQGDAPVKVVAAASGVVIVAIDGNFDECTACNQAGTGDCSIRGSNDVAINHGSGVMTGYSHMKKGSVKVKVGDVVTCGQELGEVASSGCSTAQHLHLSTGNVNNFAEVYDPYAGPCSPTPMSLWVEQGPYSGLPGAQCAASPCPMGSEQWRCDTTGAGRERCVDGQQEVEACPRGWSCYGRPAQCVESSEDPSTSDTIGTGSGSATMGDDSVVSDEGSVTSDVDSSDERSVTSDGASEEQGNTDAGPPGNDSQTQDTGVENPDGDTTATGSGLPSGTNYTTDRGACACTATGHDVGFSVGWSFALFVTFRLRRWSI